MIPCGSDFKLRKQSFVSTQYYLFGQVGIFSLQTFPSAHFSLGLLPCLFSKEFVNIWVVDIDDGWKLPMLPFKKVICSRILVYYTFINRQYLGREAGFFPYLTHAKTRWDGQTFFVERPTKIPHIIYELNSPFRDMLVQLCCSRLTPKNNPRALCRLNLLTDRTKQQWRPKMRHNRKFC